ncbi:MAG: hypothetical protein KZQ68_16365 [gamma proteobacterium symbiont of Bathyaustriella thionipta]|nr:hypothetical protein [gamma proteobacterium symbiont of Bathyaustriella thionipta]
MKTEMKERGITEKEKVLISFLKAINQVFTSIARVFLERHNKLLHWIFIPLHSVKTSELDRYVQKNIGSGFLMKSGKITQIVLTKGYLA